MQYIGFAAFYIGWAVACSTQAELVTFPVVGEYDGSGNGNIVDRNATFYAGNSSGVGSTSSLALEIESFRSEIQTAFSNGCGGVVGFDNANIVGGTQTDCFAARFSEGKSLLIKSIDHVRTDFIADTICTPISGPGIETNGGFLAKSVEGDDRIQIRSSFNFSFEEQGFSDGEHVRAVGGTILGRNGAAETSTWLMKVMLDNGDVIALIAQINFRSGNSRDDTFFGAKAPSGRYITGVMWLSLDGTHSGLDGLAFITNGPPPVPAESANPAQEIKYDPDNLRFFGIPVSPNGSRSSDDDESEGNVTLFGREAP